jgi:rhodanese-related sulfurtransferase
MYKNQNLPRMVCPVNDLEWHFRKRKRKNEEEEEQMALVEWLLYKKIPYFAVPNGGSRNKIEAAKLKKMGVSAGVPDLCIPVPNKYHHGLYIEMKRRDGGITTEEQQKWIDLLTDNGYCAVVCKGWCEAEVLIERYMQYRK